MNIKNVGHGEWDILVDEKVVGRIETFDGFRGYRKSVWVKDKQISDIKNQKEAIEKLEKFFTKNKEEITSLEEQAEQLKYGATQVTHDICSKVLLEEASSIEKRIDKLREYDLI